MSRKLQPINYTQPGVYTFTVPDGISEIEVHLWGAGGASGQGNTNVSVESGSEIIGTRIVGQRQIAPASTKTRTVVQERVIPGTPAYTIPSGSYTILTAGSRTITLPNGISQATLVSRDNTGKTTTTTVSAGQVVNISASATVSWPAITVAATPDRVEPVSTVFTDVIPAQFTNIVENITQPTFSLQRTKSGGKAGAGGYSTRLLQVFSGDIVTVIVGRTGNQWQGGISSPLASAYKGGDAGLASSTGGRGGGGGSATVLLVNSIARAIAAGGGGGGGASLSNPGAAGENARNTGIGNSNSGGNSGSGPASGGGGGGGFWGGAAGTSGTVATGGQGGVNFGEITQVGAVGLPGGLSTEYYPQSTSLLPGYPERNGAAVIVPIRRFGIKVKDKGSWKDVDATKIKVDNAWKEVNQGWVKVSGQWKPIEPQQDITTVTYSISANVASVDEGNAVVFTLTTGNVAFGTRLPWSTIGLPPGDLQVGSVTGEFVVGINDAATFVPKLNNFTTGDRTFTLALDNSAALASVIVNDTSQTPIPPTPLYNVIPNRLDVVEGTLLTVSITTSNVGTERFYWTIDGQFDANVFWETTSGIVNVINDLGNFEIRAKFNAFFRETVEQFVIRLRKNSQAGNILASSNTVRLSSAFEQLPAPTPVTVYRIIPSQSALFEGASMVVNVPLSNYGSGTLFWTIQHISTNDNDFIAVSGSVSIIDNLGSFVIQAGSTVGVEPPEQFRIQLRTGATFGAVVQTSEIITLGDLDQSFNITSDRTTTTVNEGETITWTVSTVNFGSGELYYTNSGTTSGGDFTDGVNSGNVAIVNDKGTIIKTLVNDLISDGTETIIMQLRTSSVSGPLVATAQTITVNDTSQTPPVSYNFRPNTTSINEGQTVTWTVATTNFGNGTLYYNNSGTTSAADFTDGVNSGSINIVNDQGSLSKTLVNDLTTEGSETIILNLRTGSLSGNIVTTANTVTVGDTSLTVPTYSIVPNVGFVAEGSAVRWTITTTNFGNGVVFYDNVGTASGADFSDASISGNVTITNDQGSITKIVTNELESITYSIFDTSSSATYNFTLTPSNSTSYKPSIQYIGRDGTNQTSGVGGWMKVPPGSNNVIVFGINQTSAPVQPTESYLRTATTNTKVDLTNVVSLSFFYNLGDGATWGDPIDPTDITGTGQEGLINVEYSTDGSTWTVLSSTSLTAAFNVWTSVVITTIPAGAKVAGGVFIRYAQRGRNAYDPYARDTVGLTGLMATAQISALETSETIILRLKPNAQSSNVLATADTVTIVDSSPRYTLSTSSTLAGQTAMASETPGSNQITATVNTVNVANGTVLAWTLDNPPNGQAAGSAVDVSARTGSVTINSGTGQFSFSYVADQLTENTEYFTLNVRTSSIAGPVVASTVVGITDTSVTPPKPTYSVNPAGPFREGQSTTVNVNTTNVANNTTLYWIVKHNTSSSVDFLGATSGSIVILNGQASFVLSPTADVTSEGTENFQIEIRSGSLSGTLEHTSSFFNIEDTSVPPPITYNITVRGGVASVNEGSNVIYDVTATNFGSGTLNARVNLSGSLDANDFSATSFSVPITNGAGSVTVSVRADSFTDPGESFTVSLLDTSGRVLVTSSAVTINDTSQTAPPPPAFDPPGSWQRTTSGQYSFTVPRYQNNFTVEVVGAGGGGGTANPSARGATGQTTVCTGGPVSLSGNPGAGGFGTGSHGGGWPMDGKNPGANANLGGTGNGGSTNITGAQGNHPSGSSPGSTVAGPAGAGGKGVGGGGRSGGTYKGPSWVYCSSGAAGGYASRSWTQGQVAAGTILSIGVGAGGAGAGTSGGVAAQPGQDGGVFISWN